MPAEPSTPPMTCHTQIDATNPLEKSFGDLDASSFSLSFSKLDNIIIPKTSPSRKRKLDDRDNEKFLSILPLTPSTSKKNKGRAIIIPVSPCSPNSHHSLLTPTKTPGNRKKITDAIPLSNPKSKSSAGRVLFSVAPTTVGTGRKHRKASLSIEQKHQQEQLHEQSLINQSELDTQTPPSSPISSRIRENVVKSEKLLFNEDEFNETSSPSVSNSFKTLDETDTISSTNITHLTPVSKIVSPDFVLHSDFKKIHGRSPISKCESKIDINFDSDSDFEDDGTAKEQKFIKNPFIKESTATLSLTPKTTVKTLNISTPQKSKKNHSPGVVFVCKGKKVRRYDIDLSSYKPKKLFAGLKSVELKKSIDSSDEFDDDSDSSSPTLISSPTPTKPREYKRNRTSKRLRFDVFNDEENSTYRGDIATILDSEEETDRETQAETREYFNNVRTRRSILKK